MKRCFRLIGSALLAAGLTVPAAAQMELVTLHPADDSQPAVSPDGRWLVYVSTRNGAPGMFQRDLNRKKIAADEPLYPHTAGSTSPSFSPDGKKLVFVSSRNDAFGDVFLVNFPSGTPQPITMRGRIDTSPQFSFDGSRIYFQSHSPEEEPSWFYYDLRSGEIDQMEADTSITAFTTDPPYPIAVADYLGGSALLYADDTNTDGIMSEGDLPSAWEFIDGQWRQSTPPLKDAGGIARNGEQNRLYVSADYEGNQDIAVYTDSLLRISDDPEELIKRGQFEEFAPTPNQNLVASYYRAAFLRASDPAIRAQSAVSYLFVLLAEARYVQAATEARAIASMLEGESIQDRLTAIRLAAILRQNPPATQDAASLQELRELIDQFEARSDWEFAALGRLALAGSLLQLDDYTGALANTRMVSTDYSESVSSDMRAHALLMQARIYGEMELIPESESALLRVFELDPSRASILSQASVLLLELQESRYAAGDPLIIALRNLAAQVDDYPYLQARIYTAIGRELVNVDDYNEAKLSYRQAESLVGRAPVPAVEAAIEHASLLASQQDYDGAVDILSRAEEVIASGLRLGELDPQIQDTYEKVRRALIRFFLAKGRQEMALGDPLLAQATYGELLDFDSSLAAGWRGKISALSTQPDALRRLMARWKKEQLSGPKAQALSLYRQALAHSYFDPSSRKALAMLDDAIAIDPSVAQYYLTQGFILEQQYRDKKQRGRQSVSLLEDALASYEQALGLVDRDLDPPLYADVLLNLGNAASELDQHARAATFYLLREQQGIGFDDDRTAFLFHWNFGLSSYRASNPQRAVDEFGKALDMLEPLAESGLIETDQKDSLRIELTGRQALALLDAGRLSEADARFARLEEESPADSLARVRAIRNRAYIGLLQGLESTDVDRIDALQRAKRHADRALALLPDAEKERSQAIAGGGTFNLTLMFASDPSAGASKLAFDKTDEERLLRSLLARVAAMTGDAATASEQLRQQIALSPKLTPSNQAYLTSIRTVSLNRLAAATADLGSPDEALTYALEALSISRFTIEGDVFINSPAATRMLLQATELLLAGADPALVKNSNAFWMLAEKPDTAWEILRGASKQLSNMPDPVYNNPDVLVASLSEEQARLGLVQTLAAEQRFSTLLSASSGIDGISSIQMTAEAMSAADYSLNMADRVSDIARDDPGAGESFRLAVLAQGSALRTEAALAMESDRLEAAREFAVQAGYGHLAWWLIAQKAIGSREHSVAAELAEAANRELLQQFVYTVEGDQNPWELFDRLEQLEMQQALDAQDSEACWEIAERWRAVRLRWLASQSMPIARSTGQQAWLDRYTQVYRELVSIQRDLQSRSFGSGSARRRLLDRAQALQTDLSALFEESAYYAAAQYIRPQPADFSKLDAILQSAPAFFGDTAFLLNGIGTWHAVYTPSEAYILEGSYETQADVVFTIGEAADTSGLRFIVSTDSIYRKIMEPEFRLPGDVFLVPTTETERDWRRELPNQSALKIATPVVAHHLDPRLWSLSGQDVTLGEIFTLATQVEEVSLQIEPDVPEALSIRELALASWLDQLGVTHAEINGANWISTTLDPQQNPDAARTRLEEIYGRFYAAMDEDNWPRAIVLLEEALRLSQALDDQSELATTYRHLAGLYRQTGQKAKAAEAAALWLQALEESNAAPDEMADAWREAGQFASDARDWQMADNAYSNAIKLYQDLKPEAEQYELMLEYGFALENSGRYRQASDHLESLLPRAEVIGPEAEADMYIRLARFHRLYFSEYLEAETALLSALETAQANGLVETEMEALVNLSRVLQNMARFEEGLAYLEEAQEIATQEDSSFYLSQVALERANTHWYRSEYFKSYRAQEEALRLARDTDDQSVLLSVYNVSGLTAWSLNDYDRAYTDLERAMAIADGLVEEFGITPESATTWNNLGLVYRSEGKFGEALDHFNHALAMDRAAGNRWGEAYSLRNKAITFTQMGRPDEAIPLLDTAVQITREIGDKVNEAKALLALAEAKMESSDQSEAESTFREALEKARAIPINELEWRALYGLGQLEQAAGNSEEALRLYEDAIAVVDNMRASIKVEELQDGFLRDKQDLYDTTIALLLSRGEIREALETSEKSRGRNFIDLLGNRRLTVRDSADQEMLDREKELRQRVEMLERKVSSANLINIANLREELARAREEYSDFMVLLRAESPQLSNFVSVSPVDIEELQALLDPDVRLIVYHVLPDHLQAWVVGPGSLTHHSLSISAEELNTLVRETRAGMQSFRNVNTELSQLADMLIVPLLSDLDGANYVGIVPHRGLHTLPFAPLRFGPGDHLIDRAAIFYTPSASVLRYTIGRRDTQHSNAVLSIGNPDRQSEQYNLPFAEKEAKRLQFDFDDVTVRVGGEATESWITENLQDYGIVHIASHGEYDPNQPLFSAVLLAPDAEEDGTLTAEEVFGLRVRADLVALSACQTGLGRVSSGDDIVGLNRAFVYAGTRQLLTTLWRVDDISTAVLFKYFYRNLDGLERAEALQRAQIRLKNRPEYAHPAHWSGLVLSGDWK